jgi:uncharacterized membrane protein
VTRAGRAVPYAAAAAAGFLFAAISIFRDDRFGSSGYDLGIFDQTIWGYSRFDVIPNTVKGIPNLLGDHFHPALMSLAPLYWVWDDARVLLVAQAIMIGAASIPVFWWGRSRLGIRAALCFQAAFLLFWGVLAAVVFDFHELALAVVAISFGMYALLERRPVLFWAMFALGCLSKEDIALTFAAMGVYALVVQRRPRFGLAVLASGVGWFACVLLVVIPAIAGHAYSYWDYPALGPTPAKALLGLAQRPYRAVTLLFDRSAKRATLAQMLGAWLFLPLCSPVLLIAVPSIGERFWANNPSFWTTSFQYTLPVAPILAFASIDGLARLRTRYGRLGSEVVVPLALVACALVLTLAVARPLSPLLGLMSARSAAEVDSCLDLIPSHASVAASTHFVPHLTHRLRVTLLKRANSPEYLAVEGRLRVPARRSDATRRGATAPAPRDYRVVCQGGTATVFEQDRAGAPPSRVATTLSSTRRSRP